MTEEQTLFLVKVFEDLWSLPLFGGEIPWKSHCACPYDKENVWKNRYLIPKKPLKINIQANPVHLHTCSNCFKMESIENQLKCCSKCSACPYNRHFKRYYCSVQCQTEHWKAAHKTYHKNTQQLLAEPFEESF